MYFIPDDWKMNPVEKEKWVAALRSGDYIQGRVVLRSSDDRFCCIGVRCEIAGLEKRPDLPGHWTYFGKFSNGTRDPNPPMMDFSYSGWPFRVTEEMLELFPWLRSFESPLGVMDLTTLNDEGATFDQIADLIEYRF